MGRSSERWQDDRLDDLERRVEDLEGEVSVRQDHRAILQQLDLIKRETQRLTVDLAFVSDLVTGQHEALLALVDLLSPKGSVVIDVGAISEIN